jgi:hypothetical protein
VRVVEGDTTTKWGLVGVRVGLQGMSVGRWGFVHIARLINISMEIVIIIGVLTFYFIINYSIQLFIK